VAAAAVLAGIIFSWYTWLRPVDSKTLADNYIVQHFQTLPVTMSSNRDSLQAGLQLNNEGRLEEALKKFEELAHQDTAFTEAKKYAGIVALRLGQYDKAIDYFSELEKYTQLYANPGKFYHALTLLKRNLPGDKPAAKLLLEQVVQNDLEAKATAQEWLKKM
jgi:tetratricopeptide (TPR) repeat protein